MKYIFFMIKASLALKVGMYHSNYYQYESVHDAEVPVPTTYVKIL